MKVIHVVRDRGTAMGTRMRLLTVGLALAAAAMAGCSSTTAGSSGAMQDDATASASSSAASSASSSAAPTAPASSPDPATPTAEPTGATASPVVSPTDSPSPADSPDDPALLGKSAPGSNDVCDTGLPYACGDIGASGVGTVFYASSTPFACGAGMASTCNYLEAAPQRWNGDPVPCPGGCGGSPDKTSDYGAAGPGTGKGYSYCYAGNANGTAASGTVVGSGFANTSAIFTLCNSAAANQARGYNGGGMTDWSLPSKDELNALYSYPNRNAIGGFAAAKYWSSSQNNNRSSAWSQDFSSGEQQSKSGITSSYGVRPVRAF